MKIIRFIKQDKKDFISGVGRVLDLGATRNMIQDRKIFEKSDFEALTSDWKAIGQDMKDVMDGFRKEQQSHE